jgi:hypothetical protein
MDHRLMTPECKDKSPTSKVFVSTVGSEFQSRIEFTASSSARQPKRHGSRNPGGFAAPRAERLCLSDRVIKILEAALNITGGAASKDNGINGKA